MVSRKAERFWSKVDQSAGPDGCWPWKGSTNRDKYGHATWEGKGHNAHRVAWIIANGPIPKGEGYHGTCVLHRCDNRPCCNPAHLWLGTNAENIADREQKGRGRQPSGDANGARLHPERMPRGDRHGLRMHPERAARGDANGARLYPERLARGEAQGLAKLTEAKVLEIREAFGAGEPQRAIARRFGIDRRTVRDVVVRRTWAHVAEVAR